MKYERYKLELNFSDLRIRDTRTGKIIKVYDNALRNELWNEAIADNELLNIVEQEKL